MLLFGQRSPRLAIFTDGWTAAQNLLPRPRTTMSSRLIFPKKRIGICRACDAPREKYRSYCNKCYAIRARDWSAKNPERKKEIYNFWRKNNPERVKYYERRNALKKYGLTHESFDALLESQNNACAICKTTTPNGPGKRFMVDHCHATGVIRGLLCSNCNFIIGHCKESPEVLLSAIEYLRREVPIVR